MNNTTKVTARITTLISASLLLLAPLDAAAHMPTGPYRACPGLTVDTTCLALGPTATTPRATAASCVHATVWACPTAAIGVDDVDVNGGVSAAHIELSFDKTAVADGVWQGTIDGDITGTLETRLTERRISGPIWHVRFDWIISAGDQSFVADLRGTLNNNTGAVVMNGTVVEGYLLGARVHEEGQLVDAATLQFQGSIRLMPATAVGPTLR
jgi:hypothetical protein